MKYLKLFESYKKEDILNDIRDILLEVSDMEIFIDIDTCQYSSDKRAIAIDLLSKPHNYFHLMRDDDNYRGSVGLYPGSKKRTTGNILDCILRLKDYAELNGLTLVGQNIPDNEDDYLNIDDFIEEYSGEDLYNIQLIIYKKKRR